MTTTETIIGINGMAHVMLTVSQFATARAFYGSLLPALGMTPVCDTEKLFYCVGARTAIGIQPVDSEHNGDRFVQTRVGLHHLCLRARSREDVDRLHDLLRDIGATIIQPPQEGTWAPGYYSVLFEDPDGIRLEVNFVPGEGVLQPGVKFDPAGGLFDLSETILGCETPA
jgi:catechol 2,3-dioxygenase-like lactoylglutathione lyase family enzyme